MPSLLELAHLAQAVYTRRERVGRWVRKRTFGERQDAFYAVLWTCASTPEGVLAVRGTASLRSALEDLKLLLGYEPRAWRRGRAALEEARALVESGITLTGHSLGGAFASALAVEAGVPAVVFNAPGMCAVLPHLAALDGTTHVVNCCRPQDWIRLLSGPGLGTDLHVGAGSEASVRPGLPGIADALRGRPDEEGWVRFLTRSFCDHRMSAFLQPEGETGPRTAAADLTLALAGAARISALRSSAPAALPGCHS